jgi:CubicO group peptidase (beta-lactamase class C family)
MGLHISEKFDDRFQIVSEKLGSYIIQKKLPSMLAFVSKHDEIVYCEKIGMADIEKNKPLELNHIFRIASMTKPIVSVAALMLYEEGKFSLNDPISKFIPKASKLKVFVGESNDKIVLEELERPVTMLDIFTHTGGFTYADNPKHPVDRMYIDFLGLNGKKLYAKSTKEAVEGMLDFPLMFQPGTKWFYSYSTDILGYLIEVISGKPLDVFLRERIFQKLGMQDTGFYVPDDKLSRFVTLYTHNQEGKLVTQSDLPDYRFYNPKFLSGGGGLVSTLSDYFKFTRMLVNGGSFNGMQLLKKDTIALMMQDHVVSRGIDFNFDLSPWPDMPDNVKDNIISFSEGYGFGLGVQVKITENDLPIGINGWCGVFTTDYWVDQSNGVIGIFLSQYVPLFNYPIFNEFKSLTYKALNL